MENETAPIERRIAEFTEACRRAGLRITCQRQEIFRELAKAKDHPCAEALHKRLRGTSPNISLDTVYRTLSTLASCGVISKIDTMESQGRYDANFVRHHHLICHGCKEIIDFQWHDFDEAALPQEVRSWGRIGSPNVVIYGICQKCLDLQDG